MKGERFYQALIDLVAEEHRDFDELAEACGFDPRILLACFDGAPDLTHEEFYDFLGREQVDKASKVLNCPGIRIFFLADVFSIGDIKNFAVGMRGELDLAQENILRTGSRFIEDLLRSTMVSSASALFEEFIAATFSETLDEACRKMGLPNKRARELYAGATASLKDFELLNTISRTIAVPISVILFATKVTQVSDIVWNGSVIDPMEELKAVLEIEIW